MPEPLTMQKLESLRVELLEFGCVQPASVADAMLATIDQRDELIRWLWGNLDSHIQAGMEVYSPDLSSQILEIVAAGK